MLKNKTVAYILFILVFFACWNLCDYIYTSFITHGVFEFTVFGDAILPTVVAVVLGFFTILKDN